MSKPIRVAKIIQTYYPIVGGAQQQIANVAPHLADNHIETHVITRHFPGLQKQEQKGAVTIHRVLAPSKIASPVFTFASLPLLRRLQPDIIHAYSLFSPLTTALAAKQALNVPVAVKILRGGLLGDVARIQEKVLGKFRLRRFTKLVDGFVVISQEIDQELAAIDVPTAKRFFIPNGVDTDVFYPLSDAEKKLKRQQLNLPVDVPIVIFTGRLEVEKRVHFLVNIWDDICQKHPGALLLIAGNGSQEAQLKQVAGENVNFLGRLDHVADYLQAADIFVLPSVTEGLSNSLLEAMAAGTACIATTVGGNPELIQDGESGILIEPDQQTALYDALIRILNDSPMRRAVAQAGHQFILDHYQLKRTAQRLRSLYDQLLA